jgi:hypothetical protein
MDSYSAGGPSIRCNAVHAHDMVRRQDATDSISLKASFATPGK